MKILGIFKNRGFVSLCIVFLLFSMIFMSGCKKSDKDSDSRISNSATERRRVSLSRDLAEYYGINAVIDKQKRSYNYGDYIYYDYDQTRYTVASAQENSATGKWTLRGTVSFYDRYGNYKEQKNYEVVVDIDGSASVNTLH